jgi:hypothetical protein
MQELFSCNRLFVKNFMKQQLSMKKKIGAGEHYYTKEELDAIWRDGYEQGSIDSAYYLIARKKLVRVPAAISFLWTRFL